MSLVIIGEIEFFAQGRCRQILVKIVRFYVEVKAVRIAKAHAQLAPIPILAKVFLHCVVLPPVRPLEFLG